MFELFLPTTLAFLKDMPAIQ